MMMTIKTMVSIRIYDDDVDDDTDNTDDDDDNVDPMINDCLKVLLLMKGS